MDMINDLGCELAFAVLIEKKHREKIESTDVLPLISKIKEALRAVSAEENAREQALINSYRAKVASH